MTSNFPTSDPYDAVIADLRSKREQIDQTLSLLTALRGEKPPAPAVLSTPAEELPNTGRGEFFGLSIVDGTKKLLEIKKRPLSNTEIAFDLMAGGMALNSGQPPNVVGSVLTRRFKEVGDVVKIGRGIWAMPEWYPDDIFKPASKVQPEVKRDKVFTLQINDLSSTGEIDDDDI